MTKILITYHMHAGPYEDETAIVLPMAEYKAREILTNQDRSRYVQPNCGFRPLLTTTLDRLAKLQGYSFATFICAEEVRNNTRLDMIPTKGGAKA